MADRRRAVLFICAPSCDRRAARGLVSRAIRDMLGHGYTREPYFCEYDSAANQAADMGGSPRSETGRYAAELTDVEMEAIWLRIQVLAAQDGWTNAPVDIYHD